MAEPAAPITDDSDSAFEFDLDCPSCGTLLSGDQTYDAFRVCPSCRRHFWLSGRERLGLLVEPGTFAETNAALASVDPLVFRDPLPLPDRLAEQRERGILSDAVITGVGEIGGQSAVLILLDFAYLGGSVGIVAGEKITLAMELAVSRRLPLIAICSAGGARVQEGILSVVQMAKTASAAARLHRSGVPFISVLTHPTTGGIYAGLANQADLIIAEPGAQIGFGSSREPTGDSSGANLPTTSEDLLENGLIDEVVDRTEARGWLASLLNLFADRGIVRPVSPPVAQTGGKLRVFEEISIVRQPDRPKASDYLARMLTEFVEIHGDRLTGDDPGIICGFGRLAGASVAVVAQERITDADSSRLTQGGASGYRKAIRAMRLAGHLELPLIVLVDTRNGASNADADSAGLGIAVGQALGLMSLLPIPVVTSIIGEAGGINALAFCVGDRLLMQAHAVFTVAGIDNIVQRESDRSANLASAHRVTARDCLRLGIVDAIVPEPETGAHTDPEEAARYLGAAIVQALGEITGAAPRRRLDDRSRRVRALGLATPESREATRIELTELQELQRTISRSIGDLRDRFENRQLSLPNLSNRPHLPSLPQLRKLNVNRADIEAFAGKLAATGRGLVRGQTLTSKEPEPSAPGDSEDRNDAS